MRRLIYNVLFILCLLIVGYGTYQLISGQDEYRQAQIEYKKLHEKVQHADKIDFEKLKSINPDIVAWMKVPGTRIDYPVVQGKDNEEYLHKTFSGKRNDSGSIFLDTKCKRNFTSGNSVFYGHHMKDGSMFADLVKFRKKEFVKKNQEIILYFPKETKHLTIVAAYAAQPEKIPIDFENEAKLYQYEKQIRKKSCISSPDLFGKLYTFVTCSYERDNNRTYVYAVEKEE